MTQQEIQERNKEIIQMLGFKRGWWIHQEKPLTDDKKQWWDIDGKTFLETRIYYDKDLQFHSDWNWLHQAITKIRDLAFTFEVRHDFSVTRPDVLHISIYNRHLGGPDLEIVYIETNVSKEIESTFIAVSDFAKKFNNKEL